MKPQVMAVDPERVTRDLLEELLEPLEPGVDVSIGVPEDWTTDDGDRIEVALDGTTGNDLPVCITTAMRATARSASTSRAKYLALLSEGLLLAYDGDSVVSGVRPSDIGLIAARDLDTRAELASVTVLVRFRSVPIPAGS